MARFFPAAVCLLPEFQAESLQDWLQSLNFLQLSKSNSHIFRRNIANCLAGAFDIWVFFFFFTWKLQFLLWTTNTVSCFSIFLKYFIIGVYLLYNVVLSFCFTRVWISYQFSSVTQSCPTLCDPMDCSTPGLPVHHQLPEFTQTHVHWVSDAIQPSHTLSSPSPPTFNLSQHQGLFQ